MPILTESPGCHNDKPPEESNGITLRISIQQKSDVFR